MYKLQYKDINITDNSKVIIALGDSFTQGQGACDVPIWEQYNWDLKLMQGKHEKDILSYEYEGAWVNQLCKNYMPDWTPINLGLRGCGNRATVKELYLHPSLGIEKAKEKIVIFAITGLERFDFVNKAFYDHHHFFAMWPSPWSDGVTNKKLWEAYYEDIYDDRFAAIELLLNVQEVLTWCKAHNAKFILCSAFDNRLNKKHFVESLDNPGNKITAELVDLIDWDNIFRPQGFENFTDMLVHYEDRDDLKGGGFYMWAHEQKKGTPKGYFTPCAHPSYKGHNLIAKSIYEYIQNDFKNTKPPIKII
jgi:hypothetical protein